MATINSALDLISQTLEVDQSALSIVANNVANANTTGYTREIPNWQENAPIEINGMPYGAGVTETGATSVRDRVLEQRLVQQRQLASGSGARLTALNTLQALFTPDPGSASSTAGDIGSDLTSFFGSFSSLEANPTNNALRQQVLSTASKLAGDVSNASASLSAQRSALDQEAAGVTSQVNALTSAIAQLNKEIQSASPNSDPGTLQDQRQQDISQLSELIGINQVTTEQNGLSLTTTSGQLLVSEGSSYQLTTGEVSGVTHFFAGTTDITSELARGGGKLGGYLTARDQDIPNVLSSLDQLAYGVATAVNSQNNMGTDLAGDNGGAGNIFNQPIQVAGSAAMMSLAMTDPSHIAAAALGAGTGDNSNAAAMADLANQTIVSGQTPTNYYAQFVSELGSTVSEVQTENTAQSASATQLQTQRDALSSVNLNDEASSLQQFERSYQAASEVFTILNTVMASALNLGVQTAVS
ncbi:MAG: flagellar hook-associated protein FlgK [Acidobacteriota bacterium]|nr:flagellar hook-associated protein FlgK [Acidobacteriota bacterium]